MIEMFFVAGGLAFWILSAIAAVLIIVALDRDSGWGAFWTLVVFCVAFTLWGEGADVAKWAVSNPTYIAGGIGVYLLAGAVWGVGKWALTVRKLARKCKDIYQKRRFDFLTVHRDGMRGVTINEATPVPTHLQKEWLKTPIHTYGESFFQEVNRDEQGKIVAPRARDYKASILLWMSLWPMSALWTVLDDLVKEVFENIYQFLSTWLQSIADKAFAGIIGAQAADFQGAEIAEEKPWQDPSDNLEFSENDDDFPPSTGGGLVRG
jgi:hypothetical protein